MTRSRTSASHFRALLFVMTGLQAGFSPFSIVARAEGEQRAGLTDLTSNSHAGMSVVEPDRICNTKTIEVECCFC